MQGLIGIGKLGFSNHEKDAIETIEELKKKNI